MLTVVTVLVTIAPPPTCQTLTAATYNNVASFARVPSSLQKATDLCTRNFMLDVDSHVTNAGSLTKYRGHYENIPTKLTSCCHSINGWQPKKILLKQINSHQMEKSYKFPTFCTYGTGIEPT